MKKVIKYFTLAFFSYLVLVSTLFIPQAVYNTEDMANMQFGYPVPFITQDLTTRYHPPFPWKYSANLSPWEPSPFTFSVVNFVASYLIVFIFVISVTKVIEYIYLNLQKK